MRANEYYQQQVIKTELYDYRMRPLEGVRLSIEITELGLTRDADEIAKDHAIGSFTNNTSINGFWQLQGNQMFMTNEDNSSLVTKTIYNFRLIKLVTRFQEFTKFKFIQ